MTDRQIKGNGSPPRHIVERAEWGQGDLTIFGNDNPKGWLFVPNDAQVEVMRDHIVSALMAQGRMKAAKTLRAADLDSGYFTFNLTKSFLIELAAQVRSAPHD